MTAAKRNDEDAAQLVLSPHYSPNNTCGEDSCITDASTTTTSTTSASQHYRYYHEESRDNDDGNDGRVVDWLAPLPTLVGGSTDINSPLKRVVELLTLRGFCGDGEKGDDTSVVEGDQLLGSHSDPTSMARTTKPVSSSKLTGKPYQKHQKQLRSVNPSIEWPYNQNNLSQALMFGNGGWGGGLMLFCDPRREHHQPRQDDDARLVLPSESSCDGSNAETENRAEGCSNLRNNTSFLRRMIRTSSLTSETSSSSSSSSWEDDKATSNNSAHVTTTSLHDEDATTSDHEENVLEDDGTGYDVVVTCYSVEERGDKIARWIRTAELYACTGVLLWFLFRVLRSTAADVVTCSDDPTTFQLLRICPKENDVFSDLLGSESAFEYSNVSSTGFDEIFRSCEGASF